MEWRVKRLLTYATYAYDKGKADGRPDNLRDGCRIAGSFGAQETNRSSVSKGECRDQKVQHLSAYQAR